MKKTVALLIALLLICLPVLSSCKDAGGQDYASVILSKSNLTLSVGDKYTVTADVYPKVQPTPEIKWSSSNNGVVTCDRGILTAVGAGEAVIKAFIEGGNSTSLMVKVNEGSKNARTLLVGDTVSLADSSYGSLFEEDTAIWTSSNPEVATVDGGRLVALKEGVTSIKIVSDDSTVSVCTAYVYQTVADSVAFASLDTPITVDYQKGGTTAEIYSLECEITDDGNFYNNKAYVSFNVKYRKSADASGADGIGDCHFVIELHSGESGLCDTYLIKINGAKIGTEGEYSEVFYANLSNGPRTFYLVVRPVE